MPISVTEGTTITIKGRVSYDHYRFGLSLSTTDDDSSIALGLYLSIQFDTNVVVINSKENGTWGDEERAAGFPFTRGEEFVLTVVVTADCYLIEVNGELLHSLGYRLPFSSIKCLAIFDEPNSVFIEDVSVQVTIK